MPLDPKPHPGCYVHGDLDAVQNECSCALRWEREAMQTELATLRAVVKGAVLDDMLSRARRYAAAIKSGRMSVAEARRAEGLGRYLRLVVTSSGGSPATVRVEGSDTPDFAPPPTRWQRLRAWLSALLRAGR